jgi:hypothetical protein
MRTPEKKPLVLIEFNELTPRLMHGFIRDGLLPNFERFHNESHVYVTDAEEEGENLNPWVQWVTVHTGLSASEHGIRWLSDGVKLKAPSIWDDLSAAGHRVWVCGSMNVRYDRPLNGCLLPDPWTTGADPYPDGEFDAFYTFVRRAVQEHTAGARPSKGDAVRFLKYMVTHGLSASTVGAVLRQLWNERRGRPVGWKRAMLLDLFQWDVFRSYYRRHQPQFSTFFLNSTAHFQHAYWRNHEPEEFQVKPSEADQQAHKDAILSGYQHMDALLGRIMALAGPDATLVFCTGLSQQPYLKMEECGGKHFYKLSDPASLTSRFGVPGRFTVHPVMAEQFCLRFDDRAEAATAAAHLAGFRVDDAPLLECLSQDNDLMVKCQLTHDVARDAVIVRGDGVVPIPFYDVFYQADVVKSGFHHPDGMLWVRTPAREHVVWKDRVSLRAIAPSILEYFQVPRRESMTDSLLPALATDFLSPVSV